MITLQKRIDNFYYLITKYRIRNTEICDATDFSRGYVSNVVTKKINPSENFLSKFEKVFHSLIDNDDEIDILKIRNTLNISQQELADKIGYSRSVVQKWENNERSPNKRAIYALKSLIDGPQQEQNGNNLDISQNELESSNTSSSYVKIICINSIAEEIKKLNELKESGLLTEEEYQKAKTKLLE